MTRVAPSPPGSAGSGRPTRARAERARLIIDRHYDRTLSVETLARAAHLSRYHFIRLFRETYFETPHQYLMRRRLERAKELLSLSELTVTDICFEVGFESLGSFSVLFRRVVGWPPSVYRARAIERRTSPRRFIPACCWLKLGFGLPPASSEGKSAHVSNFREA